MQKRPGLKWLLIGVGLLLVLLACGCGINAQFVAAVDRTWETIGPEYIAYVESDQSIDGNTRDLRIRTAETLTMLIEEAQK